MARTISAIRQGLIDSFVSIAASVGLVVVPQNWSKTDYKQITLDTIASGMGIMEQLFDSFTSDVEEKVLVIPPQTAPWLKHQMIDVFQYDSIANPLVKIDASTKYVPTYPSSNTTYNIIKYCSVVDGSAGVTTLKVAKESSGVPVQLTSTELSAAQSFCNQIKVPGVKLNVVSREADRLFMQLDVYFKGIYSAVIEQNVKNAINLYLKSIPFDGVVKISFLEQAILSVEGVTDVVIYNLQARPNSTTLGSGTNLIVNNFEVQRQWNTFAGFIIPEDTTGANWTLSDYRVGSSGIKNLNLISE